MNNPPEWIPLMEGVRIIARALSGAPGDAFAKEILVQAAGVLERAGREGRVKAEGVRYLDSSASPITAEDWMKLRIYESNKLDDPYRDLRAFRVRITQVVVDAHDVLGPTSDLATGARGEHDTAAASKPNGVEEVDAPLVHAAQPPSHPMAQKTDAAANRGVRQGAEIVWMIAALRAEYPDGDPVQTGHSRPEVLAKIQNRAGRKTGSPSSLDRARAAAWPTDET